MNRHRSLPAWQRCHDLAVAVHRAAAGFPPSERFELSSQLRRAATSVSANVAEGYARYGGAEFARGLSIAMGSLGEVDALLLLARDLGHLDDATFTQLDQLRDQAGAALFTLHRGLRPR
jgi:four helix bundle protein